MAKRWRFVQAMTEFPNNSGRRIREATRQRTDDTANKELKVR